LRKVSEQEARELIATIEQARSYIQHNLWTEVEASLYRLYHVENRLRESLGEQPAPHICYHQCDTHPPAKESRAEQWLKGDPSLRGDPKPVS